MHETVEIELNEMQRKKTQDKKRNGTAAGNEWQQNNCGWAAYGMAG